ncbi:MAG: FAD-dependent oxidoreductase [candidate division WOR-3 bacterium]
MGKIDVSVIHGTRCWPSVDWISPCEEACPIHMDIPGYVVAVSLGKFKEAMESIRETNPLPSVCGRVCHHPCESACNRKHMDGPLAIRGLKRFVSDYAHAHSNNPIKPFEITRSEKVAVIGAGPAGLTAAYDLARWGFPAVVFDSMTTPGGMMTKCIPDFLLPRKVLQKDIDYLVKKGVKIKTSMALGREISLGALKDKGYKAFLIATGSHGSLDLTLPGRELSGIEQAISFLSETKDCTRATESGRFLVIGGGNVAIDVARVARRMGYREVMLACLENRSEMPAFDWEVEAAVAEGVRTHFRLAPQRFLGERRVAGVEFRRVEKFSRDADGRLSWTLGEGPGSQFILDAERVVIAIGQRPSGEDLERLGITLPSDLSKLRESAPATPLDGVFVAGDIVKPQGTIVEAISDGHRAAVAIAKYLGASDLDTPWDLRGKQAYIIDKKKLTGLIPLREPWDIPKLPVRSRIRSWEEVELGYSPFEAVQEGMRCLNCRMCANCIIERNQVCYEESLRLL